MFFAQVANKTSDAPNMGFRTKPRMVPMVLTGFCPEKAPRPKFSPARLGF